MNKNTSRVKRASVLYQKVMNKWSRSKFEIFLNILKDSGNFRALQVFTEQGGEYFLANDEFDVLKRLKEKEVDGCYEGLFLEKEENAHKIVESAKLGQLIVDGSLKLDEKLSRSEVLLLVRKFLEDLKERVIWWNPYKLKLPSNFIPRRVCRSNLIQPDGSLKHDIETSCLDELTEDFILIVDIPGMGKTTEITNLEQKLRLKYTTNRIILRINLNDTHIKKALSSISKSETPSSVLVKLASFLPVEAIQTPGVILLILLDGFDEVCPKFQEKMIDLLQTLKSTNNELELRIIVTTRPHMKELIESSFNLQAWSLVPLNRKEQVMFINADLGDNFVKLNCLRDIFHKSIMGLLSNPLMLSMMVEILKSEGNLSESELTVYELYNRCVDAKHKCYLTEKEGMWDEDNVTEVRVESMLARNLPYYCRIACKELLEWDNDDDSLPSAFTESIKCVAWELPPAGAILTELISYGLLVQTSDKEVRFKHISFAGLFYSRLLLQPDTPQEVRDTLFANIYRRINVIGNVEVFLSAALSNETSKALLQPITKRILFGKRDLLLLRNFERGRVFPLLFREVLISFLSVEEDDLTEAFGLLISRPFRMVLTMLFKWIDENRQLSREILFNRSSEVADVSPTNILSPAAATLIIAFKMMFKPQVVFTDEEARIALNSRRRLLTLVADVKTDTMRKWDFVESHLGKLKFKELIKKADTYDWWRILQDIETVNKLWVTFSREELYSLVTEEETRKSDAVGLEPFHVLMSFGPDFLDKLPHFRAKFFHQLKGKSAFELDMTNLGDSCHFASDFLWEGLLTEKEEGGMGGPITLTLREAIGRRSSWEVLMRLECQVRKRRKCLSESEDTLHLVLHWVVDGGRLWDTIDSFPLQLLPFVILYGGNLNHVTKIIQENQQQVKDAGEFTWRLLLQSLVLSSHNSRFFPAVHEFLEDNVKLVPNQLKPMAEVLIGATAEALKRNSLTFHSHSLVADLSIGHVYLGLIEDSAAAVNQATWIEAVCDVILYTRCCDLPAALRAFKELPVQSFAKVLVYTEIIKLAGERVLCFDTKRMDTICCLKSLISFFVDIFLLRGIKGFRELLDFARWCWLQMLPVEIAAAVESKFQLTQFLPDIESSWRRAFSDLNINTGDEFVASIKCSLEQFVCAFHLEWEEKAPGSRKPNLSEIVFLLALTLIRESKTLDQQVKRLFENVWDMLKFLGEEAGISIELRAFFLHLAIFMGEVEWVERNSWPGLILWKNPTGQNAFDIAEGFLEETHTITRLIEEKIHLITTNSSRYVVPLFMDRCILGSSSTTYIFSFTSEPPTTPFALQPSSSTAMNSQSSSPVEIHANYQSNPEAATSTPVQFCRTEPAET